MSSLYRRLATGVGGQAFGRATIVLGTLITIPVMLSYWGVEVYGEWVVLTSLASYLTLSSFGLATAACMEMIKAASADAFSDAARIFQVAFNALIITMVLIGGVLLLLLLTLPLRSMLQLSAISESAVAGIISLVWVQITCATARSLFAGAINAAGRYGTPNYVFGTLKIVELGAILASVIFFRAMPLVVALISTFICIVDLSVHVGIANFFSPWARIRIGALDWVLLRRLIGPSLGHATIHVAVNAVVVQGPRIVLSAISGPAAVAIFGVYSMLVRSTEYLTTLVTPVLQLEFARNRNVGSEEGAVQSRRMVVHGSRFAIASSLAISVVIILTAPFVIPTWTSHKIPLNGELLCVVLATSLFTQLGRSPQSYLMGRNLVLFAGFGMLLLGACGLGIGAALTPYFNVTGMAIGLLVSEGLTTCSLIILVATILKTPLLPFICDQLDLITAGKQALHLSKTLRERLRRLDHKPVGEGP